MSYVEKILLKLISAYRKGYSSIFVSIRLIENWIKLFLCLTKSGLTFADMIIKQLQQIKSKKYKSYVLWKMSKTQLLTGF